MDITTANVSVNPIVTEPCVVKLQIGLPVERAQAIYKKVMRAVSAKASMPGFRAGKLPEKILVANFGARIREEAFWEMIQAGYREALESSGYKDKIVGEPRPLDNERTLFDSYNFDKDFQFDIIIETRPEYELPAYKGLQLSKDTKSVTDQDVEDTVSRYLDMSASYEKLEGEAAGQRDMLVLDYDATLPEGFEMPEKAKYLQHAEKTWLALREPEMLPGVSTALVGMNPGETRVADILFPQEYEIAELAGKTLSYTFKLHEVRREKRPELNDDFAKRFGCTSVDDFKTQLRKRLEIQAANATRAALVSQIDELLTGKLDFPLPPNVLNAVSMNILRGMVEREKKEGMDEEAIKKIAADHKDEAIEKATSYLRQMYLMSDIAAAEQVKFTEQDYNEMYMQFAMSNPDSKSPEKLIREKQQSGEVNSYIQQKMVERAYDKIIEAAEIIETKPEEAK